MRRKNVSEYVLAGYSDFLHGTLEIGNQVGAGKLNFPRVPGGSGSAQDYRCVTGSNLCTNLT